MEFRRKNVSFAPLEGSGPRVQSFTQVFTRNVTTAVAGIAGFSPGFRRPTNRDLGLLEISAAASIEANTVTVDLTFGLRDWSNEWDDPYFGEVDVIVLAELEAPAITPPREDLQIRGIEITQVTQFFRSDNHLDPLTVRPDNSIPLIASKPTGIRVYVDYDGTLGLPPITRLSGELEVQTSTDSNVIAPDAEIQPRRDAEIDRGQVGHTLNFFVPADLCRGDVAFRVRVFDAADPTQRSADVSPPPKRFIEAEEVRLFVVGVNYTGQGLNLPAPSLATFLNDITLLESSFPTPGVLTTGYTTIDDFSEDMNASTPCARGFTELNKLIADLKGDSDDIYIGAVPSGVNFGRFTGCANHGVASGMVGSPLILAHEVGHRFGRAHAPCDSPTRCDDPRGQDGDYPRYGNYVSDSIGEFGYDPVAGRVFDPVNSFDLMGYSNQNSWVSPYTYTNLMARTAPTTGGAPGVWRPARMMTLFLDLTVDRSRQVFRRPSFHFPAAPSPDRRDSQCGFSVEFLDACHGVLGCHSLHDDCCSCGDLCWPRSLRAELPLPVGARWLTVWEDCTKLYEECIPDPPAVSLDCNSVAGGDYRLDWGVVPASGADFAQGAEDLWYLVQWQDINGSWRGLIPRTRERTASVPTRLFGSRSQMRVRVLATSGLATGTAECMLTLPEPRPSPITVIIASDGGPGEPVPGFPVPVGQRGVRAYAIDDAGRSVPDPGFVWFDRAGREIARGPTLTRRDLRKIDTIRLVPTKLLSRLAAPGEHRWSLRRDGRHLVLRPHPEHIKQYSSNL